MKHPAKLRLRLRGAAALLALLALAVTEPTDRDTAWADLSAAVDLAAQMLRDDAWTASGSDRILHYAPEMDGLAADLTFTLTLA